MPSLASLCRTAGRWRRRPVPAVKCCSRVGNSLLARVHLRRTRCRWSSRPGRTMVGRKVGGMHGRVASGGRRVDQHGWQLAVRQIQGGWSTMRMAAVGRGSDGPAEIACAEKRGVGPRWLFRIRFRQLVPGAICGAHMGKSMHRRTPHASPGMGAPKGGGSTTGGRGTLRGGTPPCPRLPAPRAG